MAKVASEPPDMAKVVDGLGEQVRVLQGQLEAAIHGDKALLNSEERVADITKRFEQEQRSSGDNRYFVFDTRDKDKPPVEIYSVATSPKAALRDWQDRCGIRYVGGGAEPWVVTTEPKLE